MGFEEATLAFKEAFEGAVYIYDELAHSNSVPPKDIDESIKRLQNAYEAFALSLYDTLESFTDWNHQTASVYNGIKNTIDNERMFSDEFRRNPCVEKLNCLKIFGEIKAACWWFQDDEKYRLSHFRHSYEEKHPEIKKSALKTATVTPVDQTPKDRLRVQRIALFYNILLRLGVAKNVNRADIARIAEFITGGKAVADGRNTYAIKCFDEDLRSPASDLLALLDRYKK